MSTFTSERTCRWCDGTGLRSFGVPCDDCRGTGNAALGTVGRDPSADEVRRWAPTEGQLRTLHRLVTRGDPLDPAVQLASDALGRSDSDRATINAHIAALCATPPRVLRPLRAPRAGRSGPPPVVRRPGPVRRAWAETCEMVRVARRPDHPPQPRWLDAVCDAVDTAEQLQRWVASHNPFS